MINKVNMELLFLAGNNTLLCFQEKTHSRNASFLIHLMKKIEPVQRITAEAYTDELFTFLDNADDVFLVEIEFLL